MGGFDLMKLECASAKQQQRCNAYTNKTSRDNLFSIHEADLTRMRAAIVWCLAIAAQSFGNIYIYDPERDGNTFERQRLKAAGRRIKLELHRLMGLASPNPTQTVQTDVEVQRAIRFNLINGSQEKLTLHEFFDHQDPERSPCTCFTNGHDKLAKEAYVKVNISDSSELPTDGVLGRLLSIQPTLKYLFQIMVYNCDAEGNVVLQNAAIIHDADSNSLCTVKLLPSVIPGAPPLGKGEICLKTKVTHALSLATISSKPSSLGLWFQAARSN